MLLADTVRISE